MIRIGAMSRNVEFTFRGNLVAADVAGLQVRIETALRGQGLPESSGVFARFRRDGLGVIEVTNVEPEDEEQIRTTVAAELVAAHEAVITEE